MAACPDCVRGGKLVGEPRGHVETLTGAETYIVQPKDGKAPSKAIILATDIFGLSPNAKLIADSLCDQTGLAVYVPDLFQGEPVGWDQLSLIEEPINGLGFFQRTAKTAAFIGSFLFKVGPRWFMRHSPGKVSVLVNKHLHDERGVERLGMFGTCFGGSLVLLNTDSPLYQALVCAHPGAVDLEKIKQAKAPLFLIFAQEDKAFSDSTRTSMIKNLETLSIPHGHHIFPGTTHGFQARPTERVMPEFKDGLKRTADWFSAHL